MGRPIQGSQHCHLLLLFLLFSVFFKLPCCCCGYCFSSSFSTFSCTGGKTIERRRGKDRNNKSREEPAQVGFLDISLTSHILPVRYAFFVCFIVSDQFLGLFFISFSRCSHSHQYPCPFVNLTLANLSCRPSMLHRIIIALSLSLPSFSKVVFEV